MPRTLRSELNLLQKSPWRVHRQLFYRRPFKVDQIYRIRPTPERQSAHSEVHTGVLADLDQLWKQAVCQCLGDLGRL